MHALKLRACAFAVLGRISLMLQFTLLMMMKLPGRAHGQRIPVKGLKGTINVNLGGECPRARCWYYDDFLGRYSNDGLYTSIQPDGTVQCQSIHLTAFTVRSEPVLYQDQNIPYIISICVGGVGLLVSIVVLLKAFMSTKHRANAVDDESHFSLNELDPDDYTMKKR